MGGSSSQFTQEELKEYQELTYFTKKEILHVFKRFYLLDPPSVRANKNARLPKEKIWSLPELKVNPFKDRICDVFSSSGDGDLSFEDFLDMMSVFSDAAPKNVKVEYAFKVYDFDSDGYLDKSDLKQVVDRLTGEQKLSDTEMEQLVDNLFEEADLDEDDQLSFAEFEHVISKAPDFINSFRIRL
ncbi:PREDICTED: calcium and integrin-binding protein 1-like [Branchiostoma belcheri]|uniref:Calcium and integrin-binding protein 1-like n=1 Tax=Branchiostoma belcheri TaxID=7741 RepID=A0A6P4Y0S6_BRABE|nr:PREDICTED: calcium and integrin-binding protein 1-like [Branchiostoma belcheri]KAI8499178.1 Calcium and integrin-binding protein 1 [Branchiostoma belcheri]